MKWSFVLSSRFNDAEHVITTSHSCKIMTCRVSSSEPTDTALQWQHHVQWWARPTTHSTDSSIVLHFIKSDVLPHVYFTGSNGTALVNSVTCPRASRSNAVQNSRVMCRVVLQQVRWCAVSCPASVLTPNLHSVMPPPASASTAQLHVSKRRVNLEYSSMTTSIGASFLQQAQQCINSNMRPIQRVQGWDSTGDNGRSKAGSQSSMPDNTVPLVYYYYCFYPTLFFFFFWAFGFGLGFVLGLLLSFVFHINTRWRKFKLTQK